MMKLMSECLMMIAISNLSAAFSDLARRRTEGGEGGGELSCLDTLPGVPGADM